MKTFIMKADERLVAKFDFLAKERFMSRSALIRELMRDEVERFEQKHGRILAGLEIDAPKEGE